jgi:hypothetical protein
MKNIIGLGLLFIMTLGLQSCFEDECDSVRTYTRYDPVYVSLEDIRSNEISLEQGQELENPGKMYLYKNYILINEQGKGIHFYDNSDVQAPQHIGYYTIHGNFDMAIKDDILYADNIIDLIAVDISNIQQPVIVDRQLDAFISYEYNDGYISHYLNSKVVSQLDCRTVNEGIFWDEDVVFLQNADTNVFVPSATGTNGNTGVGGSTARFTIYSDYLYTVDQSSITSWDISNTQNPVVLNNQNLGWGIETIYPYKENLFIGSETGMYIFDNKNPSQPVLLSVFEHARACDPVVVENDIAYVTLRDGSTCQGFVNQLDVIDISSLTNPKLIKSFDMSNPHGLSIKNDVLYICEGEAGLKVFDAKDSNNVGDNMINHEKDVHAYDAIALTDELVMLIGQDGFYQYAVDADKNLELLSHIYVER